MYVDEHHKLVDVWGHCGADLVGLVAEEALQMVYLYIIQVHIPRQNIQNGTPCTVLVTSVHDDVQLKKIGKLIAIHVIAVERLPSVFAQFYLPQRFLLVPPVGSEEPEHMIIGKIMKLLLVRVESLAEFVKNVLLILIEDGCTLLGV